MVSAVNPGGKAESIASFAVMEKTPERVVEVIKTVVYEDPKDHTRKVRHIKFFILPISFLYC